MKKVRILFDEEGKFLRALDPFEEIDRQITDYINDEMLIGLREIEYWEGGHFIVEPSAVFEYDVTVSGDNGVVSLFSRIVEY